VRKCIFNSLAIEEEEQDKYVIWWQDGPELTENTEQFVRDKDMFIVIHPDPRLQYKFVPVVGMIYEDHQKKLRKYVQSWRWLLVGAILLFYAGMAVAAFGPWSQEETIYSRIGWYGTMTSAFFPLFLLLYLWKGWLKVQLNNCFGC